MLGTKCRWYEMSRYEESVIQKFLKQRKPAILVFFEERVRLMFGSKFGLEASCTPALQLLPRKTIHPPTCGLLLLNPTAESYSILISVDLKKKLFSSKKRQ